MPRTPKHPEATGAAKPRRTARRSNGDGASISPDEVAKRAYEIYQARGAQHGSDLDDWLEAERQLKNKPEETERRKAPSQV